MRKGKWGYRGADPGRHNRGGGGPSALPGRPEAKLLSPRCYYCDRPFDFHPFKPRAVTPLSDVQPSPPDQVMDYNCLARDAPLSAIKRSTHTPWLGDAIMYGYRRILIP